MRARTLVAVMLMLGVVVAACGDDDDVGTDPSPTATVAPSTPTTAPEPTATDVPVPEPTATPDATPAPEPTATQTPPPAVEQVVNVYWAGAVLEPTGTAERLLAGGRVVTTATPAQAALEALLAGPNALETEIGWGTAIPPGTELLDVAIADGNATVDLSAEFEAGSGTLAEFLRVGQVVFTLTQFDAVDTVSFRIEGEDRTALASHGIDVSSPVDRNDFEAVRAFVLPERPYPGGPFQSGDVIAGEANTFEANVQWVITDPDGLIIGEGFTTASSGNGTWGTFETDGILDAETAGRGSIIVFDTSAEDGSQINIVEFPIELVGA